MFNKVYGWTDETILKMTNLQILLKLDRMQRRMEHENALANPGKSEASNSRSQTSNMPSDKKVAMTESDIMALFPMPKPVSSNAWKPGDTK